MGGGGVVVLLLFFGGVSFLGFFFFFPFVLLPLLRCFPELFKDANLAIIA